MQHSTTQHLKKITLGKYGALHKKGAPRAIPTMCVLTIEEDENLHPLCAHLKLLPSAITKTKCGRKARGLLLSFAGILFISLLVRLPHPVALSLKVNVRVHFVKAFSLPTRLPLFALLAGTRRPLLMSIGFSSGLCAAFTAAHVIGTIKSALSFD